MTPRILPLEHEHGPIIAVTRPVLLVGRHPDCDIRIDLPQISRRHCCIALTSEKIMIRDLGSLHGVWLNGRRVEQAQLFPGDEIAIGNLLYRVEATQVSPSLGNVPEPVNTHESNSGNQTPLNPSRQDGPRNHLVGLDLDLGDTFSLRD